MRIVFINHTFQINYYSRRWQLFAQCHPDVEVYLLTHSKYTWYKHKQYSYGTSTTMVGENKDEGNFHIRAFRPKYKYTWISPDFEPLLLEIRPDIIYHIGDEMQPSLLQIKRIVKKHLPQTRLILFTMMGPVSPLFLDLRPRPFKQWFRKQYRYLMGMYVWKRIRKDYQAIFCHYPDAVKYLRDIGYKGNLYMQTQVGVNTEWFYPNAETRKEIRDKYNIADDVYLFGSASRFSEDKGLDDIVAALPEKGKWKYIMMGTGSDDQVAHIKEKIKERGLEDHVIMPGFVDWYEIAKYWNAIDCAIHVPRTTDFWVETFSLAVIQPMVCKKPIIGNTSGSVPYQIGSDGMIVKEGDIKGLSDKIQWILEHKEEGKAIGEKMYDRAATYFSIRHLNNLFYRTVTEDVMNDRYDEAKHDMAGIVCTD